MLHPDWPVLSTAGAGCGTPVSACVEVSSLLLPFMWVLEIKSGCVPFSTEPPLPARKDIFNITQSLGNSSWSGGNSMAPKRESSGARPGGATTESGRILYAKYVLLKQLQTPRELINIVSHILSMTNGRLLQLTLAYRAPLTTPQVSHPWTQHEA